MEPTGTEGHVHPLVNGIGTAIAAISLVRSRITVDDVEKHTSWALGIVLTLMLIFINIPAFRRRWYEIFPKKNKKEK